jgi:hypothetical protein
MRSGQDFSSQWHNRSIIHFLATLKQAEHFSDEDLLEEYRKAGLYKELAEKLLQLGRENEALAVAQATLTESRDVTWFAEQLLKSGEVWRERALGFVEPRLGEVEQTLRGKRQDFTGERTVDIYRGWLGEHIDPRYTLAKNNLAALPETRRTGPPAMVDIRDPFKGSKLKQSITFIKE